MKRNVLLVVIILCMAAIIVSTGVASAVDSPDEDSVSYNITLDNRTGEATVKISITITGDTEYSEWQTRWIVPSDAEIQSVTAAHGSATYTLNGKDILLESDGSSRSSETFNITYTRDMSGEILRYNDVSVLPVSLPGYSNTEMSAEIHVIGGDSVNVFSYYDHESHVEDGVAHTTYNNPFSFYVAYQTEEPDVVTDNLTVYGESNFNQSDFSEMYENAVMATGYDIDETTVPVVILEADEYEEMLGDSTLGYYNRGVVFIKEDSENQMYATVSHEIAHAITHTRIGITPPWFDEGTAQIAESIARARIGGEQDSFTSVDNLYEYHEDEESWVYNSSDWELMESFAYDYSEIRMKSYIKENGFEEYKNSYTDLVQSNRMEFSSEDIVDISGIELKRMCDKTNESQTIQCAENLIEYTPVFNESQIERSGSDIGTTEPTTTEQPTTTTTTTTTTTNTVTTTTTETNTPTTNSRTTTMRDADQPQDTPVFGAFAIVGGSIAVILSILLIRRR